MTPRTKNLVALTFGFAALLPLASRADYTFQDHPGEYLDVLRDGKIVARYMDAHDTSTKERRVETYKPFLHVFDADGKAPITKGPGGQYTHHRGIFIGWMNLVVAGQKYDRWTMPDGEQVHQKFLKQEAGKDRASFTSAVDWTGRDGKPILTEERTLSFLPAPAPGYLLIDMASKLKAVAGEVQLNGNVEHAGLHFRPAADVNAKETTYFLPVANADPHKDLDYPWFGETFTLGDKHYSVVYLNHPENPKGAKISAYRDYGRFGAFFTGNIPDGGERTIRARFFVAEGAMPSAEKIQELWNDYAGAHEPVPKTTLRPAEQTKPAAPKKSATAPTSALTPADALRLADACAPEEAPADGAAGAKPDGGRTKNRGPENPELKFKLPPPRVLSPQEELKSLKLPPGFKAELVASEPMINSPVAISFDDQGRMYVCEMRGYMHDVEAAGEDQPIGRISRLESTKGDGIMDKAAVFVDKLLMPRAILAIGDGVLVGEPPNLTYYRDTKGTGVADTKEIVSQEFGRAGGQPEHMANTPMWGLDNWIWCGNHPQRFRFQKGKFITEPAGGARGQWGLTQDDWGRPFFNYNSDILRADLFPGHYYSRNPNLPKPVALNYQVMKDQSTWPSHPTPGVNRGYEAKQLRADGTLASVTATCGAGIYRGGLFPAEYAGNAFVPEPSGNLVKRLILTETGGVITAKNAYTGTEFLTSTDERFRPVNVNTGPDGALYVVDMARGVIQHRFFLTHYLIANIKDRNLEAPYTLGRIFRIVPDKAKPQTVKLPKESAAIVPLLAHANGEIRDTAQRVLVERGDASVVDAVKKIAASGPTAQARVQALWTLEGLAALTPDVVTPRFKDADEKVRSAAVRLADRTLVPELVKLVNDPSAAVRVQLAYSLSAQPGPEVEQAVIALLRKGGSPLLGEAVASGLRGRELESIEALLKQNDAAIDQSGILPLLAGCVMKDRRAARVAHLLELVAAQPAGGARQLALLGAMGGSTDGKKAAPVKLFYLDSAPPALAALQTAANAKAKTFVAALDKRLAWPGKPGVPPPPKIVPLTAAQQALFEKGRTVYNGLCIACHQAGGTGLDGLAPPLLDSDWVLGPADRPMRIMMHGLGGPIAVNGTTWRLEMPPLPQLTDEDIASVLTYVRREWEHNASPVAPDDVAKVRAEYKGRTGSWTADELNPPKPKSTKIN